MALKHDEGWTIPADAPFYPPLPAVYRNVRFQFVFFTSLEEAVARFLPEPLDPSPDGTCVAAGLEVPFCTAYGPFLEAFVLLGCLFRGQAGYYCSHVFHNGPAGIAAGREIYGTPKVFAEISVKNIERSWLTEARMGGIPVIRVSTITDQVAPHEVMPSLAPSWRLKIIPRADGPGPAIKQLIDGSRAARDQVIHFCARGKGTVAFQASPYVDLTPLQPVGYGDAFYLESSYSEGFAEVVYDYLRGTSSPVTGG